MYSAISGLEAHQTMLNVTANNLANVDTIGYSAQRTTFVSELSMLLSGGSSETASNAGTNPEQVGLGVQVGSIDNIFGGASMESTGNALDVAIQGTGFLAVGTSTGTVAAPPAATGPPTAADYAPALASAGTAVAINSTSGGATGAPTQPLPTSVAYTQAGNLTTNAEGFLTTASGQYVIGFTSPQAASTTTAPSANANSTYLYIPPGSTNLSIGQSGAVTYTDENPNDANYGQTCTAGYLALASFPNQAGLTRDAGSDWSVSPNSGVASFGTPDSGSFTSTQTISGELQQSNVDMATEFTNMIEAERGYQANSSVISTADTMVQTLIQMAQS
jgi:flagellar hook protein FlgE